MNNKNTYEAIWNQLDERIKKSTAVIEWIKWELFDVLTLWDDDKSRKEVWEKIRDQIDDKIKKAKEEIYKEVRNWIRTKQEGEEKIKQSTYIQGLIKIRKDINIRLQNNSNKTDGNILDLDKDKNFNNTVLDQFAEDIIESSKQQEFKKEFETDWALYTRIKKADRKIKKELWEKIREKMGKRNLTDIQIKNLEKIREDLDEEWTYIEKISKAKSDLKEKINDMTLYGKPKVEITDPFEIKVRLEDLAVWDIIFYKHERKTWKRIERFENFKAWETSRIWIKWERPGQQLWIEDRYRVIKRWLDTVELLNITMKNEWYSDDQSTIKLFVGDIVSEKDKIEKIWIVNQLKWKQSNDINHWNEWWNNGWNEWWNNGWNEWWNNGWNEWWNNHWNEWWNNGWNEWWNNHWNEWWNNGWNEWWNNGWNEWWNNGWNEWWNNGWNEWWNNDRNEHLSEQRERVATISNVTQVNRAICQREADEELRKRKEDLPRWNLFDRANLFLRRKFIKDRIVNKKMWWSKDIFSMDWSESGQSAADRHQIEQQNDFAERMKVAIQDIDANNYPETRRRLDELLGRLTWNKDTVPPREREISDPQFQTEFTNIMKQSWKIFDKTRPWTATSTNWRPISEIIKSNNIDQLSTNILMQANKFREQQRMTWNIVDHINKNPAESGDNFDKYCRGEIQKFVNKFNDMPDFLQQMWLSLDKTDDIKTLKWHVWALSAIQAQSLKLRIQMLDDGGEAYNVKKTWWVLTKIWRFLDDPTWWENTRFGRWMNRHQNVKEAFGRVWWATKIWAMMTPALLLAPVWPLAVAGWVGWMSLLTTLFKRPSHYEKEHRSYQRMQATNLEDYRARREELANEVAWMKWYEWRFWWFRKKTREKKMIRDQYRDYVQATQDQLLLSQDLVLRITKRLNNKNSLSWIERTNLVAYVTDWLARLDYHKKTGQNFLWSNNPSVAEKEYRDLQNAVMWWAKRLWLVDVNWNPDMDQIRNNSPYDAYYNNTIDIIENWSWDEYNNQWYLKARKRYKTRRALKTADGALKAWAISFGLSYLASSLASHDKTTIVDTYTNQHNWKVWWEYNLWDMQEHLFVSWDVNPTMNSVINNSTTEITWGTLYSSVDSVYCSAAKWASELAAANADLATALSNPVVAWNPDLVSAINNYVVDATTKIWAIPWLSAWNHDLALARAIEAAKEWILEPVIASWNTSVVVNPTWLLWTNGWIQSTWWAVWQTFRNMWVMWLDYVQHWTEKIVEHVTRAIPIPRGINTFWESKKWWDWKHKTDTLQSWSQPEDSDEPDGKDWGGNEWDGHLSENDRPKKPWPQPIDPKENPDGVHKDDEPKPEDVWKKIWEVKWIVTRWQKINAIDDSDLWVEYPGEGAMLTPIQAAANLIVCHWEWNTSEQRENKFSPEDIEALNSISDRNEQIIYLANRIEEDRAAIEYSFEQQEFDRMFQEIEEKLPRSLKDIFWEDYRCLNTPMSKNRIHLVSDRDFLAVDCNSKEWDLWVFRSRQWDIYISCSVIESSRLRWRILAKDDIGTYPEYLLFILENVIHEMIHSMSAINYYDTKKEWNKSDYYPRRVGLKRMKIDKKTWVLSAADWTWFNEAATESLTWEILSRFHEPYKNPEIKDDYMAYKGYINVIEQMEKSDGIKKMDFWTAMLIRKRRENPDEVEKNTPLYELVTKINWKNRPNYYDIIMNAMDKGVDINHIVVFIKTKNINTLKRGLPEDKKLSDVFEQSLLTPDWSDFKAEILNAYRG